MEFKIQYPNGKVEEWDESIFVNGHATSYPSHKRITQKDRVQFRKMILRQRFTDKLDKKVLSIIFEPNYDADLMKLIKAYLENEKFIQKLIILFADQAVLRKDDLLLVKEFESYQGQMLSIHYFESPFRLASHEVWPIIGFDDVIGEFAVVVWIYTLRRKSRIRYRALIREIQEYYVAGP